MKKFLLIALLAVSAVAAKAQVYVGGQVGFWHNDDAKTTNIIIAPEVGYTFNEKWSAGVALQYGHYKADEYKMDAFTISPYARYTYFKSGIVNLFVDGGVDFAVAKPKDGDSATGFGIGFKPGVSLNVTENVTNSLMSSTRDSASTSPATSSNSVSTTTSNPKQPIRTNRSQTCQQSTRSPGPSMVRGFALFGDAVY